MINLAWKFLATTTCALIACICGKDTNIWTYHYLKRPSYQFWFRPIQEFLDYREINGCSIWLKSFELTVKLAWWIKVNSMLVRLVRTTGLSKYEFLIIFPFWIITTENTSFDFVKSIMYFFQRFILSRERYCICAKFISTKFCLTKVLVI